MSVEPEQESAADGARVANVCEAAVRLAAKGGLDVAAAKKITLDFADNGDVDVSVTTTDGKTDSGTVRAEDLAKADDSAEDAKPKADAPKPPPPPGG